MREDIFRETVFEGINAIHAWNVHLQMVISNSILTYSKLRKSWSVFPLYIYLVHDMAWQGSGIFCASKNWAHNDQEDEKHFALNIFQNTDVCLTSGFKRRDNTGQFSYKNILKANCFITNSVPIIVKPQCSENMTSTFRFSTSCF